jgi:hypothetical protein
MLSRKEGRISYDAQRTQTQKQHRLEHSFRLRLVGAMYRARVIRDSVGSLLLDSLWQRAVRPGAELGLVVHVAW